MKITATWAPADPNNPQADPAPSSVYLTETSTATATGRNGDGTTAVGTAADGLNDSPAAGVSSGAHLVHQTSGSFSLTRTFTASVTATGAAGYWTGGSPGQGSYVPGTCSCNGSVGAYSITVNNFLIHVNQDPQIFAPAATTPLSATVSNIAGYTLGSVTIKVDTGAALPATITAGGTAGTYVGTSQWNSSSAGNPSEHTVTAQATLQNSHGESATFDSTLKAADGRPADDIIADIRLKSLGFTGNIALKQDASTPVSTPEFTWNPANNNSLTANPAAYVQGKSVGLTITFCGSNGVALAGSATTGYTLKLQANPNATNAGTGQPIPALTLYDNTTASPVAPKTFSGSTATVTASTALGSYMARYTTTFSALNFYVQFTHVTPAPTWGLAGSCTPSGNTLYAVVATPAAPMATPWVPVLDYACQWATGATDATSATTALAKGLYDNGTYNGNGFYTDLPQDGEETFQLKSFLNNSKGYGNLTGDCRAFADFLCCLSNGIGAKSLQVQRCAAAADILPNKDGHCHFFTKSFVDAPWGPSVPAPNSWDYHEWACSDVVFDACMGTTSTPLVSLTEPNYQSAVVDYTLSPHFFQAQSAFTPTIVN